VARECPAAVRDESARTRPVASKSKGYSRTKARKAAAADRDERVLAFLKARGDWVGTPAVVAKECGPQGALASRGHRTKVFDALRRLVAAGLVEQEYRMVERQKPGCWRKKDLTAFWRARP
jgi:hypothetical protein